MRSETTRSTLDKTGCVQGAVLIDKRYTYWLKRKECKLATVTLSDMKYVLGLVYNPILSWVNAHLCEVGHLGYSTDKVS